MIKITKNNFQHVSKFVVHEIGIAAITSRCCVNTVANISEEKEAKCPLTDL